MSNNLSKKSKTLTYISKNKNINVTFKKQNSKIGILNVF